LAFASRPCSSRQRSCSARISASRRRWFSSAAVACRLRPLLVGGGLVPTILFFRSSGPPPGIFLGPGLRRRPRARPRHRVRARPLQRPEQPDTQLERPLVLFHPDRSLPRARLGLDVHQADQLQEHLGAAGVLRGRIGRQRQRASARRRRAQVHRPAQDRRAPRHPGEGWEAAATVAPPLPRRRPD
jgi:hypothetical protein